MTAATVRHRAVRVAGLVIAVSSDADEVLARLRPLCDDLPDATGERPTLSWEVHVRRGVVLRDGAPVYETTRLDDLVDFLELDLLREVAHATPALPLHAAATGSARGALLLVGASGAGKSSHALELVHRGQAYLGDEHVFVEDGPTGPLVTGWPRAVRTGDDPGATRPGRRELRALRPWRIAFLETPRRFDAAPRAVPAVEAAARLLASMHRAPTARDLRLAARLAEAAPAVEVAREGVAASVDLLLA